MPQRSLRLDRPLDEVWHDLQHLRTWEGIGGLNDLRDGTWDDGRLTGFAFTLDTPVGAIRDRADVTGTSGNDRRSMRVRTEAKGIEVRIALDLAAPEPKATSIDVSIDAKATSFLARPLAAALGQTLESGIDRERERMAARLRTPDGLASPNEE